MRTRTSIVPVAILLVAALILPVASEAERRQPFEPGDLVWPTEPDQAGFDECGCLGGLRGCLIGAAVNLDGCLRDAPGTPRETFCYLKFELDVLLCLEQAGVCQLTCLP